MQFTNTFRKPEVENSLERSHLGLGAECGTQLLGWHEKLPCTGQAMALAKRDANKEAPQRGPFSLQSPIALAWASHTGPSTSIRDSHPDHSHSLMGMSKLPPMVPSYPPKSASSLYPKASREEAIPLGLRPSLCSSTVQGSNLGPPRFGTGHPQGRDEVSGPPRA